MTTDNQSMHLDGPYENVFLNIGNASDRSSHTKLKSSRILTQDELDTLYESDGVARRIIDVPTDEMLRAGYVIEGSDYDREIQVALEDIQHVTLLSDAIRWSLLYGGSLVVMIINDGGVLEQPLNENNIREIEQLRVYDRWQVTRFKKYDDPADKRFGKTEIYSVSPVNGSPYYVHESRCLVFDGVQVPDRVRDRNDGWGASRLQACYDQLVRFNLSQYWGNSLLERAQQGIHGIPDLTTILRSPGGENLIRRRIDLVDMARSINNTVVIDAAESYDLKSTSMAGVPDIMDRLGLTLSAVTGMPEALLFGRQQGGLNSTGKADLENWYARVGQEQKRSLLPNIDRLITLQMVAMKVPSDNYLITFNPLFVPSSKELAETEYTKAKTFEIYSNIGALDASEIRQMLDDDGYELDNVEVTPESDNEEDDSIA